MHLAAAYCNAALVRLLAAWGADPLHANKPGNRPLQHLVANVELDSDDEDEGWDAHEHQYHCTIAALVAAGDRDWALVPRPCPSLEGALGAVWRAAPHGLPQLAARLEGGALERVRTALLMLRMRTPLLPALVMPVLALAFDEATTGCDWFACSRGFAARLLVTFPPSQRSLAVRPARSSWRRVGILILPCPALCVYSVCPRLPACLPVRVPVRERAGGVMPGGGVQRGAGSSALAGRGRGADRTPAPPQRCSSGGGRCV